MTQACRSIIGPGIFGGVLLDRVIQAGDPAFMQGLANQGRDKGLAHGPGGETRLRARIMTVDLGDDLSPMQHGQAGHLGFF